jgi:hypothetical protein
MTKKRDNIKRKSQTLLLGPHTPQSSFGQMYSYTTVTNLIKMKLSSGKFQFWEWKRHFRHGGM